VSEYTRTTPGLTQRVVLFFMHRRAAEIEASTKARYKHRRGGHVMEHRTAAHA
jgi:hypothetical protein